ncbi:nitroreductase family protein [Draconibacterium sp. IB214405]|uniref:nitroreductase family protein n=1 Tax=Draconibacterium sp. IB214405 TaxID=3097352 RepID=UPI002A17C0C2|nr:nitroreductase family protein [Draconibacterium sp. IB214405]MDX8339621.1 nitroreductase family protein [Draconibacterium sp. IB214405]
MTLQELIIKRRSIRNYLDKSVSIDLIQSIIKESILAPSAGNGQPWQFVIVSKREMIDKISVECKKNFIERIAANPNDYAKRYEKMLLNESFNIFYHAPAVVFIVGESHIKNLVADCSLAACYFMFSATSKGLGTCWVNFGTEINDPKLRRELGLTANHKIIAPLAVGYPNKLPRVPFRKELEVLKIIE